jgi:hypothetical protein
MTESQIQSKISDHFTKQGYLVVKLMKTNRNGIPDLMLLKDGTTRFIEVKKKGGVIAPLQKYRIEQLRKMGFDAVVMDGVESVIF